MAMAARETCTGSRETRVGDLPEVCLSLAIARTSPRDACRCAAVSPAFRAAADSDHVWQRFLPTDLVLLGPPPRRQAGGGGGNDDKKVIKDAYLALCHAGGGVDVNLGGGGGGCRVWLEKASGARCYAVPATRLTLPWDDGELSWKFTPHPLSRFAEVAELVGCTCLDVYGRLPADALTPATDYAAYLVYGTAESPCGLSFPDQEATVAVGGRVVARHAVCIRPDEAEARKFSWGGKTARAGEEPRRPRRRDDGWWEMEMGRVSCTAMGDGEEVVANFEVLGWYPKRGLIIEGVEFRPIVH